MKKPKSFILLFLSFYLSDFVFAQVEEQKKKSFLSHKVANINYFTRLAFAPALYFYNSPEHLSGNTSDASYAKAVYALSWENYFKDSKHTLYQGFDFEYLRHPEDQDNHDRIDTGIGWRSQIEGHQLNISYGFKWRKYRLIKSRNQGWIYRLFEAGASLGGYWYLWKRKLENTFGDLTTKDIKSIKWGIAGNVGLEYSVGASPWSYGIHLKVFYVPAYPKADETFNNYKLVESFKYHQFQLSLYFVTSVNISSKPKPSNQIYIKK